MVHTFLVRDFHGWAMGGFPGFPWVPRAPRRKEIFMISADIGSQDYIFES